MKLLAVGAVVSAVAASAYAANALRGHTQIPDFAAIRASDAISFGFFDSRRGVISRGDGRLLATSDGGRSWHRQGRPWLRAIDVVSARSAYATRGRWLLRTDDAGTSWRPVTRAAGALSFADRLHGWIDDAHRVLATDDGGKTLHRLWVPCAQNASSTRALSRVTPTLGFAACAGVGGAGNQWKWLYVTHDAGRRWRLQAGERRVPEPGYLASILFTSARDGLLSANRGGLAATHDGGRTWRWILSTEEGTRVEALPRSAPNSLLALIGNGALFRSSDAGRRWRLMYPDTQPGPEQVSFSTASDGIGISFDWPMMREQIVATEDAGRTWRRRRLFPESLSPYSLARVNRRIVYLVAGSYRKIGEDLYRSTDDGRTWTHVNTARRTRFFTVSFTSVRDGVLGDDAGRFYATQDGARTWTLVHGAGEDLRTFAFSTPDRGLALSPVPDGTLYETRDGGRSWHPFTRVHLERPTGFAVLGPEHIWIADMICPPQGAPHQPNCPGAIVRTADGGRTWQRIELNMIPNPLSFDFVTSSTGYAPAPPLSIYRTADGGRNWAFRR